MPEQEPSRFESLINRAKNSLESLKDVAKEKAAVVMIGLTAMGGAGVAASELEAEPANASNLSATELINSDIEPKGFVPGPNGLLSAEASTYSTLKQQCVDAGTTKSKITQAVMKNPGSRRGRTQSVLVRAEHEEFLEQCRDPFNRRTQVKAQIKDEKGRWRTMTSGEKGWRTIYDRDEAGWSIMEETPSGHEDKWYFNNCDDKKPVRIKIRDIVEEDELILVPVKGYPGLFNETYPLLGLNVATMRVPVRCK